jgi:hypothetical protein
MRPALRSAPTCACACAPTTQYSPLCVGACVCDRPDANWRWCAPVAIASMMPI